MPIANPIADNRFGPIMVFSLQEAVAQGRGAKNTGEGLVVTLGRA